MMILFSKFLRYSLTSDLTWAGYVSLGGTVRSSKLSFIEYFKLDEKNKLSLITYSVSFCARIEYLKNPSLAAKNGLKVNLVAVLRFLCSSLW